MKKIIKTNSHAPVPSPRLHPDTGYMAPMLPSPCTSIKPDPEMYVGQRGYSPLVDGFRGFCLPEQHTFFGKVNPPCRNDDDDGGEMKPIPLLLDNDTNNKRVNLSTLKTRPQSIYYDNPPFECPVPFAGHRYGACSPPQSSDNSLEYKVFYGGKRGASSASPYCTTPGDDLSSVDSDAEDQHCAKSIKREPDKSATSYNAGHCHQDEADELDSIAQSENVLKRGQH